MIRFEFLRNVTPNSMCFIGPSNLITGKIYWDSRFIHRNTDFVQQGKTGFVLVDKGEQVITVVY